jgi:hypothetical protein
LIRPADPGPHSRCLAVLLFSSALLLPGCGLGEYEKRMGEFEKRIKYVEDENANLGDPLSLPDRPLHTDKKADGEPAQADTVVPNDVFFFRPPRGISSNPDTKPIGPFLRYPGKKDSVFSAVLLAVQDSSDRPGFQKEVLDKLHANGDPSARQFERVDGKTLDYDYYLGEMAGQTVRLYILRTTEPYRVAIAFEPSADASRPPRVEDPIRFSLASLRLGDEAGTLRQAFKPTTASSTGRTGKTRSR